MIESTVQFGTDQMIGASSVHSYTGTIGVCVLVAFVLIPVEWLYIFIHAIRCKI